MYEGRRAVFPVMVAVNCLNNYFFFAGQIVFLFVYFFVRLASREYRIRVSGFVRLAFESLLGVGMGLFNLIPISPLDGSKILFALLPDRVYYRILRYERFVGVALIILVLLGVFSRPLSFLMSRILGLMCALTGMPEWALWLCQDVSAILNLF